MTQRDVGKMQTKIESEEDWGELIDQSENKLVVVDIHKNWCGVCEAIYPTLQRIITDIDDPETRILLAHISSDNFATLIQQSFSSDFPSVEFTSEPMFALYRNKECVRLIRAVDGPKLTADIISFLPALECVEA